MFAVALLRLCVTSRLPKYPKSARFGRSHPPRPPPLQLCHLLGLEPSQESKRQAYWNNLHASDRAGIQEAFKEAVRSRREFEHVGRYHVPGNGWRVLRMRGLPVQDGDGKVARIMSVVQDITEQTRVEEELHRLSQQLMRARDEERRNTARELHETAGQSLAALKMTLENLSNALPKRKRCRDCHSADMLGTGRRGGSRSTDCFLLDASADASRGGAVLSGSLGMPRGSRSEARLTWRLAFRRISGGSRRRSR